jgi:acyl-CoA dehydrogenase
MPLDGGAVLRNYLDELRQTIAAVTATNDPVFGRTGERLAEATDSLSGASDWLLAKLPESPEAALANATAYLRLFACVAGGCMLAKEALASRRCAQNGASHGAQNPADARVALARFFAENIAAQAPSLARLVTEGSDAVLAATPGLDLP